MTDPSREGGCLCGAVRYRLQGKPIDVGLCHCESCRRATGAPTVSFVDMPPGGFVWTKGEPTFYASSPGVRRGFCPTCGTSLTFEADNFPGEVHVLSATLDDPTPWAPTNASYSKEHLSWIKIDLPEHRRNA